MKLLLWTLGALAGVVLAAGVTYAASSLSTQRIGISSEPVSAGQELAPKATASRTPTPTPAPKKKQRPRPTPTAEGTAATTDWKRRRGSAMILVNPTEILSL